MGEESGEKTEEPTPHKLNEARKKGNVAKSKELTSAVMLFVAFYALKWSAPNIWDQLVYVCHMAFDMIPAEFTYATIGYVMRDSLDILLVVLAPLLFANFFAALVMELLQTGGGAFSWEPFIPVLGKLNPIEGFKKFLAMKQIVELAKSIAKMTVVIYLILSIIIDRFYMVMLSQQLAIWQIMTFTGSLVMEVVVKVGLFYIIIAIIDFIYQRWEFMRSLRMSKKEIKDEYKRLEGDPMVKQRQRDAQRQMAQGRQMGAVPGADVVVTNPIHVAIALKYDPRSMTAPKVVAKGKRLVAAEIRRIAELHQVPIVENPPLARGMYDAVELDMEVAIDFYQAVAEILAFVYNLKKKKMQPV